MKRQVITVLFILSLSLPVNALNFVLGTWVGNNINSTLTDQLKNAHFNTARINYNTTDMDYLAALDMQMIITDWRDPVTSLPTAATHNNYLRFEAEFNDCHNVNPIDPDSCKDEYYYRFTRDNTSLSGAHVYNPAASNKSEWQCTNVSSTTTDSVQVLGDIKSRYGYPTLSSSTPPVNWMFSFYGSCVNSNPSEKLYLRFALNWVYDANDTRPLISFLFKGVDYAVAGHPQDTIPITLFTPEFTVSDPLHPYTLHVCDLHNGVQDPSLNGYYIFEYSVLLSDLKAYIDSNNMPHSYLVDDGRGGYACYRLSPYIYWTRKLAVSIDYFEIEDTSHKNLRENQHNEISNILSQLTTLGNIAGVIGFDGVDEPFPSNYDAFSRINLALGTNQKPIFTNNNQWDTLNWYAKPDGNKFSNFHLYSDLATPQVLAPDPYPLNREIAWNGQPTANDPDSSTFIQDRLDWVTSLYYEAKEVTLAHNEDFYITPQCFGYIPASNSHLYHYWQGFIMPPPLMQKCLQYLPLCYGVDGIFSFTFDHRDLFTCLIAEDGTTTDNYDAIAAANDKIAVYGPILKDAEWKGAVCILDQTGYEDFPLGSEHFAGLVIWDPTSSNPPHTEEYYGFVQCGFFHKGVENYYMLVNRRAEYIHPGYDPLDTKLDDYADAYYSSYSQTVRFNLFEEGSATSEYGEDIGLLDPYNGDIQEISEGYADINIDAGEASLRQIVSLLPATVTDSLEMHRNSYAIHDVNIHHGASVTIPANKTLNVRQNTKIYVTNNSRLKIFGTLIAGDSVNIVVESGSTLDLSNAICYWGVGSGVIADSSSILISNTTMMERNATSTWKGISSTNCDLHVTNFTFIQNADIALDLNDSSLNLVSSTILVPFNGTGIKITNGNTTKSIRISGTDTDSTKIYSTGTGNTREELGIDYNLSSQHLVVDHTVFRNLYQGIAYISTVAHADTIRNNTFKGCNYGIGVGGEHGLSLISDCQFVSTTIGIETSSYQPDINNCSFEGGENFFASGSACGISLEYLTGNLHTGRVGDIDSCSFYNMATGIYCREASSRICNSNFGLNDKGITNVGSSFMNLSNGARNFFDSYEANVSFSRDDNDMQLRWGHNQFYQEPEGYDFLYSLQRNDPNAPPIPYVVINADGNYWNDNEINTYISSNNQNSNSHVVASYMDPANINYYPVYEQNRYDNAAILEDSCSYVNASNAFRDILSERLNVEVSYWGSCVDRSFKNTVWGEMDLYDLLSYFDAQIEQTPDSLQNLKLLIRDYQAKTYIELEDYQSAADLIELVLQDPESEVDSLNAVLDLEICYLLASLGESKKHVTTNFTQYKYPTLKAYTINHRVHLQQLMALMNKTEEGTAVPNVVTLSNNYPNPFNPRTTIEFTVPKQQKVKLTIFNIRGQVVKTLSNEVYEKGKHKLVWEGKNSLDKPVATGIYFYRLEAGSKTMTRKMLLLK